MIGHCSSLLLAGDSRLFCEIQKQLKEAARGTACKLVVCQIRGARRSLMCPYEHTLFASYSIGQKNGIIESLYVCTSPYWKDIRPNFMDAKFCLSILVLPC